MKKILTYIAVIAASVGLFLYLFTTQVQATNLFLSTVSTSTFPGGINMGTGCFAINNVCLTSSTAPTGTTGQVAYFSGTNTAVGTSTLFISTASRVGIGTTTPDRIFTVYGNQSGGIADFIRAPGTLATNSQYGTARFNLFTTDSKVATSSGPFIFFSESTSTSSASPMLTGAIGSVESPNPAAFSIGNAPGGIWTDLMLYGGLPFANSVATNNWLDVSGNNGVLVATSTVYNSAFAVQDLGSLTNIASFYDNTGAPKLTLSNTGTLNLTTTTGCISVNSVCLDKNLVSTAYANVSAASTATTTVATYTIAANTLTTTNYIKVEAVADQVQNGNTSWLQIDLGTGSATTTLGFVPVGILAQANVIIAATSSSAEYTTFVGYPIATPIAGGQSIYTGATFPAYSTSANLYIAFRLLNGNNNNTTLLQKKVTLISTN